MVRTSNHICACRPEIKEQAEHVYVWWPQYGRAVEPEVAHVPSDLWFEGTFCLGWCTHKH